MNAETKSVTSLWISVAGVLVSAGILIYFVTSGLAGDLNERMDRIEDRQSGEIQRVEERLTKQIEGLDERLQGVDARLREDIVTSEQRVSDKIDEAVELLSDAISRVAP